MAADTVADTVADLVRSVRARLADGAVEGDRRAEWLVGHVLGVDPGELIVRARERFPESALSVLEPLVARLLAGEPFAYVVGSADFCGLRLSVGPGVLIPRPETEDLAEWAIRRTATTGTPRVLDVGTGAGPLALAIAHARPNAQVHATERSPEALAFAMANAQRLGLEERTTWHRTDLLPEGDDRFDVVVANLPYVGTDEIALVAPDVLLHEPHAALFAGPDGLGTIRRLLARLPDRLNPHASIGLEIGWRQGPTVVAMARAALPAPRIHLRTDLAGLARYVLIDIGSVGGASSGAVE